MQCLGSELSRGITFHEIDQFLDLVAVALHDHVRVLRQDRAHDDDAVCPLEAARESARDSLELLLGEGNGWIGERLFRRRPQGAVVRVERVRAPVADLRRGTKLEQVFCADEIGVASARVVGEPETVGAEDDVICKDHSRAIVARYRACGHAGKDQRAGAVAGRVVAERARSRAATSRCRPA